MLARTAERRLRRGLPHDRWRFVQESLDSTLTPAHRETGTHMNTFHTYVPFTFYSESFSSFDTTRPVRVSIMYALFLYHCVPAHAYRDIMYVRTLFVCVLESVESYLFHEALTPLFPNSLSFSPWYRVNLLNHFALST